MNRFITSDVHFGHRNIIEYDNKPFVSVEEHDKTLRTEMDKGCGPLNQYSKCNT